jgi:glycosyltransferase involved in cell wall biosynthesis
VRTIDAIVPAFNEALTIASVVSVLLESRSFRRVLLVDDGSADSTAERAKAAGAEVLKIAKNSGKGQAMLAGIRATDSEFTAFYDADLWGLRTDHIHRMVAAAGLGYDMVCGVRDYGVLLNPLHTVAPLITGQRILSRKVIDAVPPDCWNGYAIETAFNHAVSRIRGRTVVMILPGVWSRAKAGKTGALSGTLSDVNMFLNIYDIQSSLDCHGNCKSS